MSEASTLTRGWGRARARYGSKATSSTEPRDVGLSINCRRQRLHPKVAHAEAMRMRRIASTRRTVMGNRFL